MKKSWKVLAGIAAAAALVIAPLTLTGAIAAETPLGSVHAQDSYPNPSPSSTSSAKVFVCTYDGTSGVDETAADIVSVSVSTLKDWDGVTLPFEFVDGQQRSVAIALDNGQAAPSLEECPPGDDGTEITPGVDFTPPTCDAPGEATFSPEAGVEWGSVLNDDNSTTYTASPAKGFRFPDGIQLEWTIPDLSQLSAGSEECAQTQPNPVFDRTSECTSAGWRTVTLTKTEWVRDSESGAWVLGLPVVVKTEKFYDVLCVKVITPEPPVWVDECGPGNGHWTYPANPVGYTYLETTFGATHWIAIVPKLLDGYVIKIDTKLLYHQKDSNTSCDSSVPTPAVFSADPTPPTCDAAGSLPDISGTFAHVSLSFDRPFDGAGTYVLTARALDGFTFGNGEEILTRQLTVAAAMTDAVQCEEPTDPPLIPGEIASTCIGSVPYLDYDLSLPAGYVAKSGTPLTITFVNPTDPSQNYVVSDLPLSGTLLWPGASATEPLQWPGYEQLADGTYVETDGNYAWTRDGVTVLFEVNPSYQTVVNYPPESALCANPAALSVVPSDPSDPLAATGATDMRPWAIGALALLLAGMSMIFMRRAVRR